MVKLQHNAAVPALQTDETLEKIIWHVNQVRSYPLSEFEIIGWANTLRQIKDLDLQAVAWLINEMKFGRVMYDQKLGIQNLTTAIPRIVKYNETYQLQRERVW